MARLFTMTPLMLAPVLALAMLLPKAATAADPVAEVLTPVGKTLNGEPCSTKPIKGLAAEEGLAAPRALVCGQNSEGSIVETQAVGVAVPGSDPASRSVIEKRLVQSRSGRASCRERVSSPV